MEWPAAFAWKAPPRALRRLCTKKRPAVFAAGRFFQWLMKLYEETLLLVRIRLCLQAEGLHPARGMAGSGLPPLSKIPHCCLP